MAKSLVVIFSGQKSSPTSRHHSLHRFLRIFQGLDLVHILKSEAQVPLMEAQGKLKVDQAELRDHLLNTAA